MEINWTTFALEIVNFLILVWILKHFLYRPVLNVVEQRRHAIEKALNEAAAARAEAEQLRAERADYGAVWEQEKAAAQAALQRGIAATRERLLAELRRELIQEREKAAAQEAQRERERQHTAELKALEQAQRFTTRLLARLASPELQQRLLAVVIEDLPALAAEPLTGLSPAAIERGAIISAYPLSPAEQETLRQALARALGVERRIAWDLREDRELLAGLRIELGSWALNANLRDELAAFVAAGRDDEG